MYYVIFQIQQISRFVYVKQLLCIVSQSNDVYNCIRIMVLIPNMEMLQTLFQVILFMIHVENGGKGSCEGE